jgi:hypothetical protein
MFSRDNVQLLAFLYPIEESLSCVDYFPRSSKWFGVVAPPIPKADYVKNTKALLDYFLLTKSRE